MKVKSLLETGKQSTEEMHIQTTDTDTNRPISDFSQLNSKAIGVLWGISKIRIFITQWFQILIYKRRLYLVTKAKQNLGHIG